MKPDYSDLFDLLSEIEKLLPKEWPSELPSVNTPGFWETATRQEFAHSATLTEKIRLALTGGLQSVATWSPIEVWHNPTSDAGGIMPRRAESIGTIRPQQKGRRDDFS